MKCVAYFQIFLLVTSMFSVSLLGPTIPSVKADDQEQKVCCSETVGGEHCQYTEQSNCKPGALQASTSCQQTSFCTLGCGFDQESGRCFKNTPKFTCQANGKCTWTDSPSCDIPQCQQGCCVLSNECSFVTQLQCKKVTSQFKDVNMTFDDSIKSEFACVNQCRSFERGACVKEDGSCQFTTRTACDVQATLDVNRTGPMLGFHPNKLCSNPQLGTTCAAQQYTGCLPDADEVYWFDSCGNPENIYSADKKASYNNGFVLSKEQSCTSQSSNLNNAGCGNCDFKKGTLCGLAPSSVNPTFGDYACLDLSCNNLTVSDTSPASQTGTKKLGESWCAYDGAPGFGRDLVGSRHYRRLCINGQELTEPCKDFREEICVQGVQGQPPLGTQESFALKQGDYVEAVCRNNRFQSCTDITNQLDCENVQSRDCYWIGKRVDEKQGEQKQRENKEGKCAPLVSPGVAFWPDQSTTKVSGLDPKATCDKGNQECQVTFQRPGLAGNPFGNNFGSRSWKCVGNCECLKKDYLQATNNYCKSLGDCGAWYNIKGKFTTGGFGEDNKDADLGASDVESYNSLVSPTGGKSDYKNKFGAFFNHAAPGMIVVGATGLGALIFGGLTLENALLLGGKGTLALAKGVGYLAPGGVGPFDPMSAVVTNTFSNTVIQAGAEQTFTTAQSGLIAQAAQKNIAQQIAAKQAVINGPLTQDELTQATKDGITGFLKDRGASSVDYLDKTAQIKVTAGPNGVGAGETTFFQNALTWLNTIAWIYTIYTLLDVLLADTKTETITIKCQPWVAPAGGADCDKCNEAGKECSEYRCKSLGQTCKLLNAGSKQEACVNAHPNDVTSPIISADSGALARGYTLTEVKGAGFSLNQKIEPFTAVSLGITTDEYSQCKFSTEQAKTFKEMTNPFGDSLFALTHKMTFALSSILAKNEALRLTNGGKYTLYVRCQDGNGNDNKKPYYINFAIKPGPDITAPVIEATSISNEAYVPSGVNETGLTIYTNEPSSCKWDDLDTEYEKMQNSFACTNSQLPTTSLYYGLYDCSTVLTNIRAGTTNTYYFRCKDKEGNVNSESSPSSGYKLIGTVPLEITSILPVAGTKFFVATPVVKVVTAKGAQGGTAVCGYSLTSDKPEDAIDFLTTNSSVHEQQLGPLVPGDYTAYISCLDVAGNLAQGKTSFSVFVDKQGPKIAQVYTEGTLLHITTDESSTCEFSTTGAFSFGKGVRMTGEKVKDHETALDSSVYYVVCRDAFDNDASYRIFV